MNTSFIAAVVVDVDVDVVVIVVWFVASSIIVGITG